MVPSQPGPSNNPTSPFQVQGVILFVASAQGGVLPMASIWLNLVKKLFLRIAILLESNNVLPLPTQWFFITMYHSAYRKVVQQGTQSLST